MSRSVKLVGFRFEVACQRTGFAYERAGIVSSMFGDRIGSEGEEIAPCFAGESSSPRPDCLMTTMLAVDDIVGCGYIKGLNSVHFFFTLNGNFASTYFWPRAIRYLTICSLGRVQDIEFCTLRATSNDASGAQEHSDNRDETGVQERLDELWAAPFQV